MIMTEITHLIFFTTIFGTSLINAVPRAIHPTLIHQEDPYRNLFNLPMFSSQPAETAQTYTKTPCQESHINVPENQNIIANDELHQSLINKILANPAVRNIIDPFSGAFVDNPNGVPSVVNNYIIVPSDYLKLNHSRGRCSKIQGKRALIERREKSKRNRVCFQPRTCLPDVFLDVLDVDPNLRPKCQRDSPTEMSCHQSIPISNDVFNYDCIEERNSVTGNDEGVRNVKRKVKNSAGGIRKCPYNYSNRRKTKTNEINARNSNQCPIRNSQNYYQYRNQYKNKQKSIKRGYKPMNMYESYPNYKGNFASGSSVYSKQSEDVVVKNLMRMYPNLPESIARSLLSNMRNQMDMHKYSYGQMYKDQNSNIRSKNRRNNYYNREGTRNRKPKSKIRIEAARSCVPMVELNPGFVEIGPVHIAEPDHVKDHVIASGVGYKQAPVITADPEIRYQNDELLPPYYPESSDNIEETLPMFDSYIIEDYYPDFTGDHCYTDNEAYEIDNGCYYPNFESDEKIVRHERNDALIPKYSLNDNNRYKSEDKTKANYQMTQEEYKVQPLENPDFKTTKIINLVSNDLHPIYEDDKGGNKSTPKASHKSKPVETVYSNSKVVVYPQSDSPEGFSLLS